MQQKAFADIRKDYEAGGEIEVSEQADSDLRGIFEYIAFELQALKMQAGSLTV